MVIDDIPGMVLQHPCKKLADNQWHTVLAEKQRGALRLTVAGHLKSSSFYSTDFFVHTDKALYIGGYPGNASILVCSSYYINSIITGTRLPHMA